MEILFHDPNCPVFIVLLKYLKSRAVLWFEVFKGSQTTGRTGASRDIAGAGTGLGLDFWELFLWWKREYFPQRDFSLCIWLQCPGKVRVRKWANRFCSQCVNKAEPRSVCSVHELISNNVPNLIFPLLSSLSVGHFNQLTFKMFIWGFVREFKFPSR